MKMQAVIIAGGKGTRLKNMTRKIPKSMIKIDDKTLLEFQIELLKKYKIKKIKLMINHLGHVIKNYFGNGNQFGVNISYYEEKEPLGTAGCVTNIAKQLNEDFLIIYGDLLINMDLNRLIKYHKNKKSLATLVVHPNKHPYDSDLVETDENSLITNFYPKPHSDNFLYQNLVNAAIYILNPLVIRYIPQNKYLDFGKDVFPKIIKKFNNRIYAFKTHEYIKDIGTFDRIQEAIEDVKKNFFSNGSYEYKRPAIFLDRDGTINKEVNHINKVEDVQILNNAYRALQKINKSNYLAIIITNQPQAAKGICDIETINKINRKIEVLLGKKWIKLDGIYCCYHHPEKGFPGENSKYKIKCKCRKPEINLIRQAVEDFNIDLSKSYFIGDTTTDAMTAKNAGIKFIGVETGYRCKDNKYGLKLNSIFKNLNEAVNHILDK